MKNHYPFRLHFLRVGETLQQKHTELLGLGKKLGASQEIVTLLASKPRSITEVNLVIADVSVIPPPGVVSLVPAHGRCQSVPGGIFLNGKIDYTVPIWPGYGNTVCLLEACSP